MASNNSKITLGVPFVSTIISTALIGLLSTEAIAGLLKVWVEPLMFLVPISSAALAWVGITLISFTDFPMEISAAQQALKSQCKMLEKEIDKAQKENRDCSLLLTRRDELIIALSKL